MPHEAPTPAPKPRTRRRRANVERILDAATDLAFEEGIDALSMQRVADRADYTAGALYRYFSSKDALLAAVVVRVIARLKARVAAASADSPGPLQTIVAQADAYRRFAAEEPHGYALVAHLVGDPRVLLQDENDARAVMEAVVDALPPLAVALQSATDAGALAPGDVRERALLLFTGLQGALQLRKQQRMAPGLIDTDHMARAMVRSLLAGWGAHADALEAAFRPLDA